MNSVSPLTAEEYRRELESLLAGAVQAFAAAGSADALEDARVHYLGAKNGLFKSVQKQLGAVAAAEKPLAGKHLNEAKERIQEAFDQARQKFTAELRRGAADPDFDASLPGTVQRLGKLHPITQTIEELIDIMGRLGFTPAQGPEIEDEWHNFVALNIPASHPARDPLDNFYLSVAGRQNAEPLLLRSQTSTVQIRVMEQNRPPVRIISLGRVYRPDTADPTHYPMFHQIEGLMVDRRVTLADLKTVLKLFATNYLGSKVPIRIRPSFFPFTEPSVEADYFWNGRWVEFGGAGMVDPNVFAAVGYDPEEYSGFAFGLGIERLCMIRHQITDIRHLFTNDVRFLRQF